MTAALALFKKLTAELAARGQVRDVYRLLVDDSHAIRLAAADLVTGLLEEQGQRQLEQVISLNLLWRMSLLSVRAVQKVENCSGLRTSGEQEQEEWCCKEAQPEGSADGWAAVYDVPPREQRGEQTSRVAIPLGYTWD